MPGRIARTLLLGAWVAALGCRRVENVTVELLSGSAAGRLEAVLDLPSEAALKLRADLRPAADDPGGEAEEILLEVWIHRGERPAELVLKRGFDPAAGSIEVSAALPGGSDQRSLLAAKVAGISPQRVRWVEATVTGKERRSWWRSEEPTRDLPGVAGPDIILYLVDALRADALGCYGGPVSTPHFDRLAAEGVRYENAATAATWTRPATASLMTGLYPSVHRAVDRPDLLTEAVLTLAERLRLSGYQTAAAVANGNVDSFWGFDQGFESYVLPVVSQRDSDGGPPRNLRATQVHAAALELWGAMDRGRPRFLFVHTVDPHGPYAPPSWLLEGERPVLDDDSEAISIDLNMRRRAATPELMRALWRLYLGEVAFADDAFGDFRRQLEEVADPGRTLWILTSDHGEAFQEHGASSHGMTLFEEELRVPLILRGGRVPAGRVESAPVSLIDVVPTLMGLLGRGASGVRGVDLSRTWRDGEGSAPRPIFAEIDYDQRRWQAVRVGSLKLLVHHNRELRFAFDLSSDPGELRDLYETDPSRWVELEDLMAQWSTEASNSPFGSEETIVLEPDPDLLDNLRALGYLE